MITKLYDYVHSLMKLRARTRTPTVCTAVWLGAPEVPGSQVREIAVKKNHKKNSEELLRADREERSDS